MKISRRYKSEQMQKLRDHFKKHGKKRTYKYYARRFDLTTGAVCNAWRDVQSGKVLEIGLYKPTNTERLLNEVWR